MAVCSVNCFQKDMFLNVLKALQTPVDHLEIINMNFDKKNPNLPAWLHTTGGMTENMFL